MSATVVCPHCRTNVPHGARVCTGCQAEVEYGTPPAAIVFSFFIAAFLGWWTGSATHPIVGWLVFALALGGAIYGCSQLFKDRINFKRIYRTK